MKIAGVCTYIYAFSGVIECINPKKHLHQRADTIYAHLQKKPQRAETLPAQFFSCISDYFVHFFIS